MPKLRERCGKTVPPRMPKLRLSGHFTVSYLRATEFAARLRNGFRQTICLPTPRGWSSPSSSTYLQRADVSARRTFQRTLGPRQGSDAAMRFDAEGHLSITPRQLLGLAYADRRRLIDHYLIVGTPSVLPTYASYYDFLKSAKVEGDSHQIWRIQVIVASLMIVSSVFREAESSIPAPIAWPCL